jgi:FkbM family methyltransferase
MLKAKLKRVIRDLGYEIRRYQPSSSESARFLHVLKHHRINLVFDVGANAGQFAASLRTLGYSGRIVSFEPVSGTWEQLAKASHGDSLWEIAPRCALGEEDSEIEVHVSANSVSSSVLNMLNTHLDAAPTSAYVSSEQTPLMRLDTIGPQYLREDSRLFIKIDTQGYETQVLNGAERLLDKAIGLHVEMSLVPLYAGQDLYDGLIRYLQTKGFELWDITPNFVDMRSGRALSVDAILFRA